MKRLLFTVFLWAAALQGQGRMMVSRGPALPPPRSGPVMAARPAPMFARPAPIAGRPMPAARPFAGVPSRGVPAARMASPQTRVAFTPAGGRRIFISDRRFHHRHHFRHVRPFFVSSTCFNRFSFDPFFCGSAFGYPYYPLYPYDYSTPAPAQPQPDYVSDDTAGANRELSLQVQRLSDEVESLREQERRGSQPQPQEEPTDKTKAPAGLDDSSSRILVFRDGRQLLVENYAVSGNTIWVLDDTRPRKFPLSDIDIAATQKANADNGDEFHLPAGAQRQ